MESGVNGPALKGGRQPRLQRKLRDPPRVEGLGPLQPGEELWVEVTVPPAGPPRAIQLAVSGNGNFTPIKFK